MPVHDYQQLLPPYVLTPVWKVIALFSVIYRYVADI